MKKKVLYSIILIVLLFIGYLGYTYHSPTYREPGMISSNIYNVIPTNEDDIKLLVEILSNPGVSKKIDNLSGKIEVTFDKIINMSDGIGYKILFNNTKNTLISYIHTTSHKTWYFDNNNNMTCEGSGCPSSLLGKLLNSITISQTPGIITDILIGTTGNLQVLQGENGSWISTIERGL